MNQESAMARAVTAALAIALAAPLIFPANLNPAVSLIVGAATGGALCLLAGLWGRHTIRTSIAVALGSGAAFAAWLTFAALTSVDPPVSMMGTVSQHTGAALWLVVVAWAASTTLLAERQVLRQILGVVSIAGTAYAVMGVVETLTKGSRGWGSAAGPFENSSSLGAFLAISLFACLAWFLASRTTVVRSIAAACGAITVVGIAAAESRSGVAGVAVAAVVMLLLWLPPKLRTDRRVFSVSAPVSAVLATTLMVAAAAGKLGPSASKFLTSLGTMRDTIWRSAAAQFAQSPWFGSGPEQFSAWVTWSFTGGLLRYSGTYDPHNVILGVVLGGGVVALALWAFAAGAVVWAQVGVLERTGRPRALVPVLATASALIASAMFAWVTPAAAIAAAALTGALYASDVRPAATGERDPYVLRGAAVRVALVATAIVSAVVVAVGVPMLTAEAQFVDLPKTAGPEAYVDIYKQWADPTYAATAVDRAFATNADAQSIRSAMPVPLSNVAEHVNLALADVFLAQAAMAGGTSGSGAGNWDRLIAAIETGVHADPASALWYTVAAAQADADNRPAERALYARKALALNPPAPEAAYLENLLKKK